jgi:uncharacterized protein YjiS (DUF1127 family)
MRLLQCSNDCPPLTAVAAAPYFSNENRYGRSRRRHRLRKSGGKRPTMLIWTYLVTLWRRWRTYRRTRAELMQLDDRSLSDIALTRAEIDSVAREAARCA